MTSWWSWRSFLARSQNRDQAKVLRAGRTLSYGFSHLLGLSPVPLFLTPQVLVVRVLISPTGLLSVWAMWHWGPTHSYIHSSLSQPQHTHMHTTFHPWWNGALSPWCSQHCIPALPPLALSHLPQGTALLPLRSGATPCQFFPIHQWVSCPPGGSLCNSAVFFSSLFSRTGRTDRVFLQWGSCFCFTRCLVSSWEISMLLMYRLYWRNPQSHKYNC